MLAISDIPVRFFPKSGSTMHHGGEEFVMLLLVADFGGVLFVVQRIRTAIHNLQIPHASSAAASHVTVSLGVACLTAVPDGDPSRLIQLADEALYEAKKGGRDKVVLQISDTAHYPN